MKDHAIFLSDIHLGPANGPRSILFLNFLKELQQKNITHLFLLGDIFDLWIADKKYFIEKYDSIINEIKKLIESGVEVHYFEGNHDLYLEHFWGKVLGAKIYEGPASINLGSYAFRIEHGDQIDLEDKGYIFLRWLLRTPVFKFIAKYFPGRLIKAIGEKASHSSRAYTSETKTITQDRAIQKIRSHAEKELPLSGDQFLITGHLHVRDDYSFNNDGLLYRSINLGTWLDKPCYLEFKSDQLALHDLA